VQIEGGLLEPSLGVLLLDVSSTASDDLKVVVLKTLGDLQKS
jgi:hypothetical protein